MKRTPASITVLERIKDPYGCRALIVAWASPINLSHVWSPGIWEHEEAGAKTGGNRISCGMCFVNRVWNSISNC